MITRERRAKRADGAVYRQIRRQRVAGKTLLEANRPSHGNVLQLAARTLSFLLKFVRPRG